MPTTRSRASSSAPAGCAEPTFSTFPPAELCLADDCIDVNEAGGLHPFEWQRAVLRAWLGTDRFGRWAAGTCGLSVPRQNGKSLGTVEARANYGMLVLGESVVYTAHLQKTATETFEDMAAFFDSKALKRHVKSISYALGRESIKLKNGGRIKFLARTRAGGRGQHGDLLVFDEAQELDPGQQASFLPAISASRNPQTVYAGTPPDENAAGVVFARIRRGAVSGTSTRTAWAEWGVDSMPENLGDRGLWARVNPSLGITIQETTVEDEFEQMDPERFAQERLGWWREQRADAVIPASEWAACAIDVSPTSGVKTFAVKFSPDGSRFALSACVRPKAGPPYVECVEIGSVSHGLLGLAAQLASVWRSTAQIVVDGASNSGAFAQALLSEGVPSRVVVVPTSKDVATACSMLANAAREQTVSHSGQPALDASATGCRKRPIGQGGGWGFAPIGDADPGPVESCALAYWAAATTKRDPSRKLRIG